MSKRLANPILVGAMVAAGAIIATSLTIYFTGDTPGQTEEPPISSQSIEIEGYYIRMERHPCDGFCPAYIAQLSGNGTIFFDGFSFVPAKGHHTSEISQEQIGELIDEFERISFFELDDIYGSSGCIGCGGSSLSFTNQEGRTKTVRHIFTEDVPQKLLELEERIEEILEAKGWLNPINN